MQNILIQKHTLLEQSGSRLLDVDGSSQCSIGGAKYLTQFVLLLASVMLDVWRYETDDEMYRQPCVQLRNVTLITCGSMMLLCERSQQAAQLATCQAVMSQLVFSTRYQTPAVTSLQVSSHLNLREGGLNVDQDACRMHDDLYQRGMKGQTAGCHAGDLQL